MLHRRFRTCAVDAFLNLMLIASVGRLGSTVSGTWMAAASARNTATAAVPSTENDTCAGSDALPSLGSGVTLSGLPAIKCHEHRAWSHSASSAVRSCTVASVVVTGR